jgi:hypothetical protein
MPQTPTDGSSQHDPASKWKMILPSRIRAEWPKLLFDGQRSRKVPGGRYFTFFGRQSFFFLDETTPQSLQRKSPGLALRIGFPFWQLIR